MPLQRPGNALLERKHRLAEGEVRLDQTEATLTADHKRAGQLPPVRLRMHGDRDVCPQEVTWLGNGPWRHGSCWQTPKCDLLERQYKAMGLWDARAHAQALRRG